MGRGPNRSTRPGVPRHSKRQPMLNVAYQDVFRYELRRIFAEAGVDPDDYAPLVAQIIAKASRISIEEANIFLESLVEREEMAEDVAAAISKLLDRNTRYR